MPNISQLALGRMLPVIRLTTLDGIPDSTADYRNKYHLILLVAPSGYLDAAIRFLEDFANHDDDIRDDGARLLILSDSKRLLDNLAEEFRREDWLFRQLENSEALEHLLPPNQEMIVYVIDRFGEIIWISEEKTGESILDADEILAEIRFQNLLCPE